MQRVELDARTVFTRARRGTGKNLIDLYRRLAILRPGWRFEMLHRCAQVVRGPEAGGELPTGAVVDPFADLANVSHRRIEMPGDRWNLWQQLRLPLAARWAGADLLHCPANTAPRHPLVPMVVTIHDLIPLETGSGHPNPMAWGQAVGAAARMARRIITPSEFSKGKLVETFGIPADKICVVYWAPDGKCSKVTDAGEIERVRLAYGVENGRRLAFGYAAADPRKNTRRILESWAALPSGLRNEWTLVLVGIQQPALLDFRRQAKELSLDDNCRLHGFAPEPDMAPLMSAADVLYYPSLSEGFGLPVLDAFACDAAVLTSNVTSLPEVAGDAAVLVDPEDTSSMTEGLANLLGDEAFRNNLAERGRQRVKLFTWKATAERVCDVFEQVIGER